MFYKATGFNKSINVRTLKNTPIRFTHVHVSLAPQPVQCELEGHSHDGQGHVCMCRLSFTKASGLRGPINVLLAKTKNNSAYIMWP